MTRRRVVAGVTLGHFLSHFYILVYPPLFPFLAGRFGLSNARLGLVMSVGIVGPLFLQLPVGRVVDRVGGKWTLVGGLALTGAGTALVGTAGSFRAVLLWAGVAGLGQSVFHPADYALLEAASGAARRGRTFSFHTVGGYAGFAAAPVVVGTLAGAYGWRPAVVAVGCAGVGYALLLAAGLPPAYRRARPSGAAGTDTEGTGWWALVSPPLLALVAFYFLTAVAVKGIQTFGPRLLSAEYGLAADVGNLALALFFVGAMAGILLGGRAADALSESRVIVGALSAAVACLLALASGVPVGTAAVGTLAVVGLAVGLTLPSRDSLVGGVSPAGVGSSFGLVFTGLSLGGVLAPPLLGAVADASDLGVTFLAVALCYGAAMFVVSLVRAPVSAWLPTG